MIEVNLDEEIEKYCFSRNIIEIKQEIEAVIQHAIKLENVRADVISVSIVAASRKQIREYNKNYRKIDKETDVLSFPIFEKIELEKNALKEIELGDIILCLEIIEHQAEEYETGIKRELLYMITHGMFHLLGYDHMVEQEKTEMRKKEEWVLKQVINHEER